MDVSKLPKLSQSDPPPKNDAEQSGAEIPSTAHRAQPVDYRPAPREPISAGEIWFGVIVGVIFLLLGGTFARYCVTRITHQPFHTNYVWPPGSPKAGQEVEYLELETRPYLTDAGMFLIGLAIVLDALVRLAVYNGIRAARALAYLTFAITLGAAVFNLYVVGALMGSMLPLLSLLAVAMGGYIAFSQWQLLKTLNRAAAPRRA
jgi:hypothetical protein